MLFLSAAIGQRPRNYLSCCPCSCSSPFGSFPLKNKFKWKKFLPSWGPNQGRLAPQPSTLSTELWQHWYKMLENYLFNLRISRTTPQTLDQYWSTLVSKGPALEIILGHVGLVSVPVGILFKSCERMKRSSNGITILSATYVWKMKSYKQFLQSH